MRWNGPTAALSAHQWFVRIGVSVSYRMVPPLNIDDDVILVVWSKLMNKNMAGQTRIISSRSSVPLIFSGPLRTLQSSFFSICSKTGVLACPEEIFLNCFVKCHHRHFSFSIVNFRSAIIYEYSTCISQWSVTTLFSKNPMHAPRWFPPFSCHPFENFKQVCIAWSCLFFTQQVVPQRVEVSTQKVVPSVSNLTTLY